MIATGTKSALACMSLCVCSSCGDPPPPRAPSLPDGVVWSYEVVAASDFTLAVEATFVGPIEGELAVDEAARPFVTDVAIHDDDGFHALSAVDPALRDRCATRCRIRYQVRLDAAATALADVDTALSAGGALFAPPSTWLLRPSVLPATGRYRFHVVVPAGMGFETGVRPAKGATDGTYEAPVGTLEEASFAAFGALRVSAIAAPDIRVVVARDTGLTDEEIGRWLKTELEAMGAYLGPLPEDRVRVFVAPGTGEVMRGKTLGGGGASVLLRVGTKIDRTNLLDDWVAAHELFHAGFPALDRDSAWFSEGLASYVEPVARARAGLLTRDKFWGDLLEGLPGGQPQAGDTGLEGSTDIGRIYWGGSLFFLLADIEIRTRTSNARSLRDAVRAVVDTGANVESHWSLDRVLDVADAAIGSPVLHELYRQHAHSAVRTDLPALWRRLGVVRTASGITYDNEAPLASVRRSITK